MQDLNHANISFVRAKAETLQRTSQKLCAHWASRASGSNGLGLLAELREGKEPASQHPVVAGSSGPGSLLGWCPQTRGVLLLAATAARSLL